MIPRAENPQNGKRCKYALWSDAVIPRNTPFRGHFGAARGRFVVVSRSAPAGSEGLGGGHSRDDVGTPRGALQRSRGHRSGASLRSSCCFRGIRDRDADPTAVRRAVWDGTEATWLSSATRVLLP